MVVFHNRCYPKKRSVIRIDAIYKASMALILSKRLHPTLNMKIDASNSKFVKSLKWPIFNAEHIQIFSLWKLGKKLKAQYVKFSSRNIEQTFTVNEIGCECHVRKQYGQRLWIIWICEKMIGFRISNRIGIIRFTILMKLAQRAFFPTTLAGWKIEATTQPWMETISSTYLARGWNKFIVFPHRIIRTMVNGRSLQIHDVKILRRILKNCSIPRSILFILPTKVNRS